jgi:Ring finger domain
MAQPIIDNYTIEYIRNISNGDETEFSDELHNMLRNNRIINIHEVLDPNTVQAIHATSYNYIDDDYQNNYDGFYNTISQLINLALSYNDPMDIIENDNNIQVNLLGDFEHEGGDADADANADADTDADTDADEDDEYQIPSMAVPTREPLSIVSLQEEMSHGCTICFRPLELVNLSITRCGHIFHVSCLDTALQYNPCCPHCRTQLRVPTIE